MKTFLVHIAGRNKPLEIKADSYEVTRDGYHVRFHGSGDNYPDVFFHAVDYIETASQQPIETKEKRVKKRSDNYFKLGFEDFTKEEIDSISRSLKGRPYIHDLVHAKRGKLHGFHIESDEKDRELITDTIAQEAAKLKK